MSLMEQCLNEVCTIASEGKLNSEQKLRISTLCRKVGSGTSQMAVQFQSLKIKAVRTSTAVQTLQDQLDLSKNLYHLQCTIDESSKHTSGTSFANMVKKGTNNNIPKPSLNSVAMKLQVRGLRKTKNGGVIISTDTNGDKFVETN
ncbi:unnamed protein product [Arctia plantaginis]|uniref:Uncharacterized protein n=1 Tax=Arctia plantaginis TaxID=874455 RepID=A0A8S0ZQV5_ARCPL|nr:unnamed protein product [Arctia plantaginis]